MSSLLRPAIVLFLILTVITGIAYPLVVTGSRRWLFPSQAGGSLIVRDGKAIGSRLIGQSFSDPKYFWSRPSATSPQPYNGARLLRLESRAAQPGADGCCQGANRGASRSRSDEHRARSGRSRHCLRQWPGS